MAPSKTPPKPIYPPRVPFHSMIRPRTISSRTFPNPVRHWTMINHRHWIEQWRRQSKHIPHGRIPRCRIDSVSCWNMHIFCIRRRLGRRLHSKNILIVQYQNKISWWFSYNVLFKLDYTWAGQDHSRCHGRCLEGIGGCWGCHTCWEWNAGKMWSVSSFMIFARVFIILQLILCTMHLSYSRTWYDFLYAGWFIAKSIQWIGYCLLPSTIGGLCWYW